MEKHPLHLKNPFLQKSPEVQKAVDLTEHRTGESIPNDPSDRIEAYMSRLERIFLHPDASKRKRNLEMFRDKIYDAFIIKRENFPESYFTLQQRVARERGQVIEEISVDARERVKDVEIANQKASLDSWIDYLISDDAKYPPWFKFIIWNNITKLSQFDKERGKFKKRTETTVAKFPDIYRGALAKMADRYIAVKEDNTNLKDPEIREAFNKKFPKLYAEEMQKALATKIENKEEIQGEWIKYQQGDEEAAKTLYDSLENKGTGWCTEGMATAKIQINSGDFHVYYTNDKDDAQTQPRLAIRMNGSEQIGEVRGVLPNQNVEPILQDTLDNKLEEFGTEADTYRKKSDDMKLLTKLEAKQENNKPLTKDDLTFLYELNSPIEGFGYEKDPRIEGLRQTRNSKEDMLIIFDCTKDQIATTVEEIKPSTKAFLGPLTSNIFQQLPEDLDHIYTSFPEGRIKKETITIGGKTAEQLTSEMQEAGIKINDYAKDMLKSPDFRSSKQAEQITLISLTVADLGFSRIATDQIYKRAKELGLELCPSDTGPNYRLQYQDQPLNEWSYIAMKQIAGSAGSPRVFGLERSGAGLWLCGGWAEPEDGWGLDGEFVFRLRPPSHKATVGKQSA
jgi:hypothetical protein